MMEIEPSSHETKENSDGPADVMQRLKEAQPLASGLKIWRRVVSGQILWTSKTPINISFSSRLKTLERNAKHIQYLLACFSTLGGANHLCNRPAEALVLARQQEHLGHTLGSSDVVIRARVFQAVNYALLGHRNLAHAMFPQCESLAIDKGRDGSLLFVRAVHGWLIKELVLIDNAASAFSGGDEKGE